MVTYKRDGLIVWIILYLAIGSFSCGSDEPSYTDRQVPVFEFAYSIDRNNTYIDNTLQEMGTVLEFLRAGRITQLCARMPEAGVYRVTLWNTDVKTALISVNIDLETGIPACVDIPVQYVDAGDRLTISVLSDDYYEYLDLDNLGSPLLPAVVGNVEISYGTRKGGPDGLEYPDQFFDHDFVLGLADVVYEREE